MHQAAVGFHCPECSKAGQQKVVTGAALWNARPLATQVLIAINVAVFALSILSGDGVQGNVSEGGLLFDGGLFGPFIDVQNEWYRILTAGFLHYGFIHLGFNMYALWALGPQFERSVGRLRFVLVYLACLVAGSFGALLLDPLALTAGASGAIYGLLGVAVLAQRSIGRSIWDNGLGTVLLLNFALTFGLGNISVGGHVGGFVAGLLSGWLLYDVDRRKRLPKGVVEAALVVIGVAAFVGALWAAGTWPDPVF